MEKLFVSGDSWTSCWPLEETTGSRDLGWPALVAKHFGWELTDKSRASASNHRIYRKAFDAILNPAYSIVIVEITKWDRLEAGWPDKGKIYQHVPNDKKSKDIFTNYFNGYLNYSQCQRMIISMQQCAKLLNKPVYFLQTFPKNFSKTLTLEQFHDVLKFNKAVFDAMDDARIASKFKIIQDLNKHIDFSTFISDLSFMEIIKEFKLTDSHPVADGHAKMAEVIIEFLHNKNYKPTI